MCREKPETGSSLENTSVNVAVWGAVEVKAYVIFKMVYMKIKCNILKILNTENDRRNSNRRSVEEKIVF
jgi:hypothetical protein